MAEPQPADPNVGFPNPHAEHFEGERTPEEQYEYEQQQKARQAAAGTTPAPSEQAGGQSDPFAL